MLEKNNPTPTHPAPPPPPPRIFVLILLLLLLPIAHVKAADITVNSSCTLADAITAANTDTATGGCTAGSGDDTITLTANITLSAEPTAIASNITIEGANKTISGDNLYRILRINSGTVRINNLTLTKGRANDVGSFEVFGGAIYAASGSLTITESSFIDNIAPEPGADCASSYGGAVLAFGSALTIEDSVFRGNRASLSSAILAGTSTVLTLRRSSFTGHGHPIDSAQDCQDGLNYVIRSQMNGSVISNVTVSGNSASGIRVTKGTTTISHSTIVNNKSPNKSFGAGLRQYDPDANRAARVNLYNTIIADNTPKNCEGSQALSTWLLANVNNLIKTRIVETEESDGSITRTEVTDCNPAYSDDPKLASFRGSPGYHPLWEGSPAIDAATTNCASVDIRGVSRPVGAACDLGAYEGFLALPSEDEGEAPSAAPGAARSRGAPKPTQVPHCAFCDELLALGYRLGATYGFTSGIQFRRLGQDGIGDQAALAGGFLDALDVYGYVEQGVEVCFPMLGRLLFLDAATAPRAVSELPSQRDGYHTCARLDRPGTLVLAPGDPAPAVSVDVRPALANCMVRTLDMLNFRAAPAGEILQVLPYNVTLTALARAPGWFKVDYHGAQGWVSADYVQPQGDCG
ncbi:MAG: SH3 domain-containing protein [Chloroflexi bacterium]|nr:SH3 domain-containing protein [Chloroflexota bacterium]